MKDRLAAMKEAQEAAMKDPSRAMTYSVADLETLEELKRTYEQPDKKQRLTCEFQHGLLVDEITAKRISKPGESDSSKSIWSPGEIAQTPGPGEGNEWLFEEAKPGEVDMLLAKARSRSLKRQ